jgi:uncharacterized membrane protein
VVDTIGGASGPAPDDAPAPDHGTSASSDDSSSAPTPDGTSSIHIPALCNDTRRSLIAIVVSLVVPTVIGTVLGIIDPEFWDAVPGNVLMALLGWNLFVVVYLVLTVRAFGDSSGDEFAARIAARPGTSRRKPDRDPLARRGDGPTFAIEASLVAFAVVLIVPQIDAIRLDDLLLVPALLSILLSCWALSVVSYALHYAQKDLAEPGLDFPGERTHGWGDYLYFSIAVATTFGATDVNITTPRMRRVVNVHTILTFLYNSVIVALLAAVLIR